MVYLREGARNISPPHLAEAFWEQDTMKMGRCDPNSIIIYFFIPLDFFRVEKVKE